MMFTTMAKEQLGRGATPAQVQDKANELFEKEIDTYIGIARGPQNAGAGSSVVQDALAVIGE